LANAFAKRGDDLDFLVAGKDVHGQSPYSMYLHRL
jgi:hypothetical protein